MNEKMKKLREEFAVLDKNGSGNISLTEMKAALEKKAQCPGVYLLGLLLTRVNNNFKPAAS